MTPCFDETAKKHSSNAAMGTCMGLLHLVDGFGRMLGAAFALAVYGWMRNSSSANLYWPVVVATFLVVTIALHIWAYNVAGERYQNTVAPGCSPLTQTDALDGAVEPEDEKTSFIIRNCADDGDHRRPRPAERGNTNQTISASGKIFQQ
jgi:hypothetical protein